MVDLMGKKYYFFALSIIIIIAGAIGFLVNGLQLDIQFEGGTILEIPMSGEQIVKYAIDKKFDESKTNGIDPNKITAEQAKKLLGDDAFKSLLTTKITQKAEEITKSTVNKIATAQLSSTYNSGNTAQDLQILTVKIANKQGFLPDADMSKLQNAFRQELNLAQNAQLSTSNVAPFIGAELLKNGLMALLLSSLCIIIYIWWRFKIMSGPSAGVMAVLAMIHDALIMLAVYTIFKIPVNDSFIAAVLTILGYSMNDTIIIYDRIRENSSLLRKTQISELVNKSIIQTLNRSINTVVTVLICLVVLLGFSIYYNIVSIKDFTLPLIIGITSGCYSSIFIASPLWVIWKESQTKKTIKTKTKTVKV